MSSFSRCLFISYLNEFCLGKHTLVGNWQEERALREATGFERKPEGFKNDYSTGKRKLSSYAHRLFVHF